MWRVVGTPSPARPPGHPKYKFRYSKYKFRHPKYKFRYPKYKFRHPKYKFRHPMLLEWIVFQYFQVQN